MKTKIITGLKKEVLVIELPEYWDYEIIDDDKTFLYHPTEQNSNDKTISGYKLLGKPNEIKEEDAEKLVEKDPWVMSFKSYRDYSSKKGVKYNTLITAIESFNSALEKEIYWENPFNEVISFMPSNVRCGKTKLVDDWKEAQEKTFDRNKTLIFVKN